MLATIVDARNCVSRYLGKNVKMPAGMKVMPHSPSVTAMNTTFVKTLLLVEERAGNEDPTLSLQMKPLYFNKYSEQFRIKCSNMDCVLRRRNRFGSSFNFFQYYH